MKKEQITESGFTLIEVVLATILAMIVVAGATGLLFALASSAAAIEERQLQSSQDKKAASALREDFETVGFGLTERAEQKTSGDLRPEFLPHNDYQIDPDGRISRTGSSSGEFLSSSTLWRGSGSLSVSAGQSLPVSLMISGETGNQSRRIDLSGSSVSISENGETVYAKSLPDAASGIFSIGMEQIVSNEVADCRLVYRHQINNGSKLLYESRLSCLSDWVVPSLKLAQGGELSASDYQIYGSEMTTRTNSPIRFPLFPFYQNERVRSPFVKISSSEFMLLRATAPFLYLSANTLINGSEQNLAIRQPENLTVSLEEGEILFLTDYWQTKSCLLKVVTADLTGGTVRVRPVVSKNDLIGSAFQDFYSPASDFSGHEFRGGAKLAKLAAPVAYKLAQNFDQTYSLFRREAGGVWSVIVPSLRNFALEEKADASGTTYFVSYDLTGELLETADAEDLQTRLQFAPRSMNRLSAAY